MIVARSAVFTQSYVRQPRIFSYRRQLRMPSRAGRDNGAKDDGDQNRGWIRLRSPQVYADIADTFTRGNRDNGDFDRGSAFARGYGATSYADLNGSVLGARANADPARTACSEGILGVANFKDCFGGRQIQPSREACSTSFPSLRIIRLNLRYPRFSFAFNSRFSRI
jgi:hypothetical protein